MSSRRFAQLLIAALVVLAGGWFLAAQRDQTPPAASGALLPGLSGDANAVTAVTIRRGAAAPTVTVHKSGGRWTVAERADYPADTSKLRKLLESLRDAHIVEEKTSDPARFAGIGVDDPSAAGALGVEVAVVTPNETRAVIIGKSVGGGNFARRRGENRSYSVEPPVSVESEPQFWIDTKLLDLQAALIQSVEVKPLGGPAYREHRLDPKDGTYALDAVPAGRRALDAHALAPGPTTFTGVAAEDVAPVGGVDFGQSSQTIVTLSDGNVVTLTGAVAGTKHWLRIAATKDEALSAAAAGRAFEIASYRYDAIFKPLEQLLEPKPADVSPAAKSAKGKASGRAAKAQPASSPEP